MKDAVKLIGAAVVTACIAYTGYSVYKYVKLKKEMADEGESEKKKCHYDEFMEKMKKSVMDKVGDKHSQASFTC